MRHAETNPYREVTLSELARACNEAVGELEERRWRTGEEKEAFAGRLRFLLLAIAGFMDFCGFVRALENDEMVPRRGLEPPRFYPLVPETSASTNSATWAGADAGWHPAGPRTILVGGGPCQRDGLQSKGRSATLGGSNGTRP